MRIVTWNINSLRLRLGLLEEVVAALAPDVICLQETKVADPLFPADSCRDLGFPHQAYHGMKGYNGVAILSRLPLEDIRRFERAGRADCRHLAARVAGLDVHSLYIPAGGDVADPDFNPKFAHKLAFIDELAEWLAAGFRADQPILLAGDFNVAPLETDVWSHRQLLGVVSHTPVEIEGLARLQASLGWVDAVRHFVPPSQHLYTWWSYRSPDWTRNDRGRRLDHVWVTPVLADRLRGTLVAREIRAWGQPSDHVPVLVDLDVGG
ncbi:MAG: exodeoxyribonuclease III [Magnetospirillum sp.]|nr:MAG: exodeoxyribonuclease III [Magnetospirillum sp.]